MCGLFLFFARFPYQDTMLYVKTLSVSDLLTLTKGGQDALAGVEAFQFSEEGKALSPFFVNAVDILLESELIVYNCT